MLRPVPRGFTLTEMAIVLFIISLLIGGAMMTLQARTDQHNFDETNARLNQALEALTAFAIVNRRLPCPATANTTGDEVLTSGTFATGGTCSTNFGGFLPARTIGFQPTDSQGYALDTWGNRLRYAVSNAGTGCTTAAPFFTSVANLKANGVSCRPNDIDICGPTTTATACTAANRAVTTQTVVVVVFSTGRNGGASTTYGAHETENTDGDAVFISRTPSASGAANGAYDDLMVWMPAGALYTKLLATGALP